LSLEEELIKI
jgi:hypothetical protein